MFRSIRWVVGKHLWPVRINRIRYLGRRLTHRWRFVHRCESSVTGVITVWDLGRERRVVFGDNVGAVTQSTIFTHGGWSELRREYWGRALGPPVQLPPRPRVLVLGLGGGTMVRLLHRSTNPALVTVVERDPAVADVAMRYMGLASLPALDIQIGDVQEVLPVLAESDGYDLVIEDVFFGGLPKQDHDNLVTYVDALAALVAPAGWLVLNRWFKEWSGAPIDSGQDALAAVLATRFPQVQRHKVAQRWFNELLVAGGNDQRPPETPAP